MNCGAQAAPTRRFRVHNKARVDPGGAIWRYLDIEAGPQAADMVVARLVEAIYRAADLWLLYRQRREPFGSSRRLDDARNPVPKNAPGT